MRIVVEMRELSLWMMSKRNFQTEKRSRLSTYILCEASHHEFIVDASSVCMGCLPGLFPCCNGDLELNGHEGRHFVGQASAGRAACALSR